MNTQYILEGHDPVPEPDLLKWARWFETAERTVRHTHTERFLVSTVFLGFDYGFGKGPPICFETMVFGRNDIEVPDEIEEQWRYATWDDAEAGHTTTLRRVIKWEQEHPAVAEMEAKP